MDFQGAQSRRKVKVPCQFLRESLCGNFPNPLFYNEVGSVRAGESSSTCHWGCCFMAWNWSQFLSL